MMPDTVTPDLLAWDDDSEPTDDEGMIRIPDAGHGDRKIRWKRKDPKSVARAKGRFDELKAQGYRFFRLARVKVDSFPDKNGGELVATKRKLKEIPTELTAPEGPVTEFEPAAKEYVGVRASRGG